MPDRERSNILSKPDDWVREYKNDPEKLLTIAEELAVQNRLDEAEQIGAILLLGDDSNSDAWNLAGFVQCAKGQFDEALKSFNKAYVLNPNNINAAKNLLDILIQTGQIDQAMCVRLELQDIFPDDTELQALFAQMRNGRLDADQWHDAIVESRLVEDIAAEIRAGQYPEWIKPLLMHTKPGEVVLELGSGTGAMSAILAQNNRSVILVDYSRQNLDFSRKLFDELGLRGEFVLADVTERLSFTDGFADMVWSSGLLEHFNDNEILHILSESARIAGNKVMSLVPNASSLAYRLGKWQQEQSGTWDYGHEDPKWTMSDHFVRAGLMDVKEYSTGVKHSLAFLTAPETAPAAALLSSFFETLEPEELRRLNQGYLLATIGCKRKIKKLAVVPSDPLDAYEAKGNSHILKDYYNPAGCFDEVYCLSPFEKAEQFAHGMHVIPTTKEELPGRIRELGIDIVRAYGGFSACDFACAGKTEGVPVVVSVHDGRESWLYDSIRQADHVIAVSSAVRDLVLSRAVSPERVHMLPNRIDLEAFKHIDDPEIEAEFRSRFPGKYRILHVGRKDPQKNADTLIRALRYLGSDYTAVFIGRGDDDTYRKLAEECGVAEQCHFIQSVPNSELPKYYSAFDCMCTPSRSEGFGIVFIEALACEAMVITSNIGPMGEYITNGVNGILVDRYEDPETLAEAVARACTDKELRANLKSNAREAAIPFGKEKVDQAEAKLYKQFLCEAGDIEEEIPKSVASEISKQNSWYVGSQFEWAEKPCIRPIYQKRFDYFVKCIERAKRRFGGKLRMLDAGCGDGYWLWRLGGIDGVEVEGVDYNPVRVERALKIAPGAHVTCQDLASFHSDNTFDIVILSQVIEHIEDDMAVLSKIRSLLRDGGVLILGTPNEGSRLHQYKNRKLGESFETDHFHFYTEKSIREKIQSAGFDISSVMREAFFLGNDELYYKLTQNKWGFELLSLLTNLCPSECSDYYFECRLREK